MSFQIYKPHLQCHFTHEKSVIESFEGLLFHTDFNLESSSWIVFENRIWNYLSGKLKIELGQTR
jgi:hypothetical protein